MSEIRNPEKGIIDYYRELYHKLRRTKGELKFLKRELLPHIANIENAPKELAWLIKCLNERKEMLRKEGETSGYINQVKNEILENVRQKIKENLEETKDMNVSLAEEYFDRLYNINNIEKEIEFLETEIRVELKSLEHSKVISTNYSKKIEELTEIIEELEPKVKQIRDLVEEKSNELNV
ncbi:MAG: hypothetical protein ACFFDF_18270 [Candidatus Odinarchaeota archaeon]